MSAFGSIKPLSVWALVPVKAPIWAKTRLADLLSDSERADLQWAMLQDVLDQLLAARELAGVAIVCPDPRIQALAQTRGVRVIGDEPPRGGLNAALALGTERLRQTGADLVAILPGDVPMLDAADIDRAILCAIHGDATVVVPDTDLEGTNALVFRTERTPQFQFGKNSFSLHSQDVANGPVKTLRLKSIARDIDWPDDLTALRRLRGGGAAPQTNSVLARCAYLTAAKELEKSQ